MSMEMKYVIPKIAFPARLVVFAGCAAVGLALQVLIPGGYGFLPGLVVMVPGLIVSWARNFRNKPMDVGQEDWQPASVREFDRIKSNIQMTRQKRYAVIYRAGFGWFIAVVLAVLALIFSGADDRLAALLCADALVLLLPFLFSGNVSLWTPQELAFRMRVFEPILSTEQAEGGDIIITPYLKLDKDKEGHQIPEDIRLDGGAPAQTRGLPRRAAPGRREQGPQRQRPLPVFRVPLQGQGCYLPVPRGKQVPRLRARAGR